MTSFLQSKGLYKFITDRAEALKQLYADNADKLEDVLEGDEKALGYIKCNILSSYLDIVITSDTALDAWKKLETFFAGKETYNKIHLLEQLIDGKLIETGNPVNDVQKFIRDKNEIVRRLDSTGMKIANDLQVAIMLSRLPESFDTMRRILESQPDMDLLKFTAELNREAIRHSKKRQASTEKALFAGDEEPRPFKKPKFNREDTKNQHCDYCNRSGHTLHNCWFNPKSPRFRPALVKNMRQVTAKSQVFESKENPSNG